MYEEKTVFVNVAGCGMDDACCVRSPGKDTRGRHDYACADSCHGANRGANPLPCSCLYPDTCSDTRSDICTDARSHHGADAEADAVQELIAENAQVAQNQDDYNRRYDEMVSRFEATKAERDALAAEIRQRGIRRREFERFITTLESLPDEVTDFSEDLCGSLVEYLTVYAKDDLRFMLPCEVEIEA